MPEGDTVAKHAAWLRPLVVGQALSAVHLRGRARTGLTRPLMIESITTHGKHLFLQLRREVIHIHLGMNGRWQLLEPAAPWPARTSLGLELPNHRLACTRTSRVELLDRGSLSHHSGLSRLGPDLLQAPIPLHHIAERAHRYVGTAAAVLLDQSIAAGLGNVYKSELLFLHGIHPETAAACVTTSAWRAVYADGARLLTHNLGTARRQTTGRWRPLLWVYGRSGRPCLKCRTPIRGSRLHGRRTAWCPACQSRPSAA